MINFSGRLDFFQQIGKIRTPHEGVSGVFAEFNSGLIVSVDTKQLAHIAGGNFTKVNELPDGECRNFR